MSPDVLSIIRDIAITMMSVVVAVAAVVLIIVTLKIYPKIRRAATNFEASSCLMLDTAARISGMMTAGSELATFVWDLVTRLRRRSDDKSEAEGSSDN
jgi:hypothetical protein